jgi:hypothetical protein
VGHLVACRITGREEARIGPYGRKVKRWTEVRVRVYVTVGEDNGSEVWEKMGRSMSCGVCIDDERGRRRLEALESG